jgi:hypothetical protein
MMGARIGQACLPSRDQKRPVHQEPPTSAETSASMQNTHAKARCNSCIDVAADTDVNNQQLCERAHVHALCLRILRAGAGL